MNIIKKIKQKSGESITETLVATLIAAMSMVIFASMVIASKNIIKDGNERIQTYYAQNSKLTKKDSGLKSASAELGFSTALINDSEYDITVYSNENSGDETSDNNMLIIGY